MRVVESILYFRAEREDDRCEVGEEVVAHAKVTKVGKEAESLSLHVVAEVVVEMVLTRHFFFRERREDTYVLAETDCAIMKTITLVG